MFKVSRPNLSELWKLQLQWQGAFSNLCWAYSWYGALLVNPERDVLRRKQAGNCYVARAASRRQLVCNITSITPSQFISSLSSFLFRLLLFFLDHPVLKQQKVLTCFLCVLIIVYCNKETCSATSLRHRYVTKIRNCINI